MRPRPLQLVVLEPSLFDLHLRLGRNWALLVPGHLELISVFGCPHDDLLVDHFLLDCSLLVYFFQLLFLLLRHWRDLALLIVSLLSDSCSLFIICTFHRTNIDFSQLYISLCSYGLTKSTSYGLLISKF
jgi:hypothetical protein